MSLLQRTEPAMEVGVAATTTLALSLSEKTFV
jgi:hypothetical protein